MSSESSPKEPELEPKAIIRWESCWISTSGQHCICSLAGASKPFLLELVDVKERALSLLTGVFSAGLQQPLKEQPDGSSFRIQAQKISLCPSMKYQGSRIILGRFDLALENWRL